MRGLILTLLLTTSTWAQPGGGFSPTMPFGIPAYSSQAPANSGGNSQCPGGGFSDAYYRGWGWGGFGLGAPSASGGDLPGYRGASRSSTLPGYSTPVRPQSLPGYDRPARKASAPPGY